MDARMNRRRFTAFVIGAIGAGPAVIRAQPRPDPRRIGFLSATTRAADSALIAAFIDGLREWGWVEGTNLQVEYRWSSGDVRQLPGLARDLPS